MRRISLLLFLLTISSGSLFADTPDPDAAEMQLYASQLANPHEAWLKEAWTDDNAPYQKIRQTLDALNSNHLITISLMDSYRQSYREHPNNPEQAFLWVYATYLIKQSGTNIPQEDVAFSQILDRFPRTSPKTYDYTRLRFLLAVEGIAKPKYKAIAARLYQANSKDAEVTANYARVLSMTYVQGDQQKALTLVRDLIRQKPHNPKNFALLGSVYIEAWYRNHNAQDAASAIAAYQNFLHDAPLNNAFRSQAKFLINMIQTTH